MYSLRNFNLSYLVSVLYGILLQNVQFLRMICMSYLEPGTAWNLLNDYLNRNGSIWVQAVLSSDSVVLIVYPYVRSLLFFLTCSLCTDSSAHFANSLALAIALSS